jgi:predicted amidohydrolase YtcJ
VSESPQTLYRGGTIRTPDLDAPAGAMLVGDGRVRWLGPDTEAERHVDVVPEVVQLEGRLVTPAFVDAHVHLSQTGAGLRGVDLASARSLAEALSRVESAARASAGRPVYVQNWDETAWPERRPFTGAELDRATYGGVVYAPRVDGHSAVISSALAAAARVVDADGRMPDGLVITDAHHRAREAFTSSVTSAQRRDDIALALQTAAAAGIGLVHENGGPVVSSAEDFADVLDVAGRGGFPEVIGYWAELVDTVDRARELTRHHGAQGLAGDLNVDGSIGSRTASLREPYADRPGHRGNAFLTALEVRDHVAACTRAGLQAGFHVIGDLGVDTVIEGMELAAALTGADAVRRARHRLEHLEMIDADGVRRLAALGVVASVQPAFDAFWGGSSGMYAERLGPERVAGMNPFRTMADAGMRVALGSDSPVTPFAPWDAVRACVQHHDRDQRTTVSEAFRAHTVGGYDAALLDGRGELGPGGKATFVVWDHSGPGLPDLSGSDPAPAAQRTVVDGQVVHDLS